MTDLTPFLGLPFRRGGRGPFSVDCWGLVKLYLEIKHGIPGLQSYADADPQAAIAEAMAAADWSRVSIPRDGDVAVMLTATDGGRVAPLHVGVMVSHTHVLHVDEGAASVCLSLQHPLIAARLHGFWRHKAFT